MELREIKFRIWDKKYSTFDYNASPDVFIGTDGEVYDREERTLGDQRDVEYVESDNYVISQWTGLHDKNGKEIYEGDIVQGIDFDGDKYESLDIVEFVGGRFVLKSSDDLLDIWIGDSEIKEMEVIGNIYDNPELLKEEVK